MPVRLKVGFRGVEEVTKGLAAIPDGTLKIARGRIYGRFVSAHRKLTTYPDRFSGRYPFKTDKQRRYVMWAIKTGLIKVPYVRTGRYGRGWQIERTKDGYALSGRAVQNGRDYTKPVGGSAYGTGQARIHKGRWPLLRDVVEQAVNELPAEIADAAVMVARREGFKTA